MLVLDITISFEHAHLHKTFFDYCVCVLSGFHIFMKTVNNLPKYLEIRDSRIYLFGVFSLSPSRSLPQSAESLYCVVCVRGSFISQMNIAEHWELSSLGDGSILHHNKAFKLDFMPAQVEFLFDSCKNALAYCCEWNVKKKLRHQQYSWQRWRMHKLH